MTTNPIFEIDDTDSKYWIVYLDKEAKRYKFRNITEDNPDITFDAAITKKGIVVPARVYFLKRKFTYEQVKEREQMLLEQYWSHPDCKKLQKEIEEVKEKGYMIPGNERSPPRWVSPPRSAEDSERRRKSKELIVDTLPTGEKREFVPYNMRTQIIRKYRKEIERFHTKQARDQFILDRAKEVIEDRKRIDKQKK
jgi:hypothetical protein